MRMEKTDKFGNKITIINGSTIMLRLKKRDRKKSRNIGRLEQQSINGKNITIYTKHSKNSNIFRKDVSIGLNYELINLIKPDIIHLTVDRYVDDCGDIYPIAHFWITYNYLITSNLLENTFLHFKQQGFELQLFIGLNEFILTTDESIPRKILNQVMSNNNTQPITNNRKETLCLFK